MKFLLINEQPGDERAVSQSFIHSFMCSFRRQRSQTDKLSSIPPLGVQAVRIPTRLADDREFGRARFLPSFFLFNYLEQSD